MFQWFLKTGGLILTIVFADIIARTSIGPGNEKPFSQSYGLDYREVIDSSKSSSTETEESDWLGEHIYIYRLWYHLQRLLICWNFVNNSLLIAEISKLILKMAGEPELTGLAKHFNSVTFTGRANVAKVGSSVLEKEISSFFILLFPGNLRSHPADSGGREGQELHEEMNIFSLF